MRSGGWATFRKRRSCSCISALGFVQEDHEQHAEEQFALPVAGGVVDPVVKVDAGPEAGTGVAVVSSLVAGVAVLSPCERGEGCDGQNSDYCGEPVVCPEAAHELDLEHEGPPSNAVRACSPGV